nr:hypothetical protein [Gemmatimonadaceae bacterium]
MRVVPLLVLLSLVACHRPGARGGAVVAVDSLPRLLLEPPVRSGHEFAVAESPDGRVRVLSRRTFATPKAAPTLHLLETRRSADGRWSVPM